MYMHTLHMLSCRIITKTAGQSAIMKALPRVQQIKTAASLSGPTAGALLVLHPHWDTCHIHMVYTMLNYIC